MKKFMLLFPLLVFSCSEDSSVDSSSTLLEEVWLKYKQTISIGAEPIYLTFNEVLSESRCPSNVVCVWQGEANLEFKLFTPSMYERKFNLKIEGFVGRADTVAHKYIDTLGYRITLMQLDPYPHTDSTRQIADYSALMKIKKLE
ncbi:MAG: hypothetical protein FJ213_09295 [Ignavibacteria bacterium]|nr:hypothetical protein [Ignavibacteria bacterium]